VLTAFSDASRRTSCISTMSSLHLDPPMRGYTTAASYHEPTNSNGKAHTASI
jgi:hypothetical protein